MTNAILKRLAQKGLISVRKINNRNIHYVVSAAGMEEIARRSYRYLRRTIKNVVYYKHAIGAVVDKAAADGYESVVLVGNSDLDFIVEHWCNLRGMNFRAVDVLPRESFAKAASSAGERAQHESADCDGGNTSRSVGADRTQFFVYSENMHGTAAVDSVYLRQVLAAAT